MAGLAAQQLSIFGKVLGAVAVGGVGHLVQKVAAVEADAHFAVHALRVKAAHPAANQVFAGAGFVVGLPFVGQAGGYAYAGPQLAIHKQVQLLGQLINDDAVLFVGGNGFQKAGFHIAADDAVIVVDALNQRPAVFILAQHMHAGGCAVDKAALPLVDHRFAIRRVQRIDRLFFFGIQNGDGLLQQFPAGFLVGDIIMEVFAKPRAAALKASQIANGQVILVFVCHRRRRRKRQQCAQQNTQQLLHAYLLIP